MKELDKTFNPKEIEEKLYAYWKDGGFFHATIDKNKKPYTIVIPPPNVTGVLHMGHGLNNTLQDILIRYHRMLGFSTLWLPGCDHAGIATQNVVERRLRAEGKNKHDLGREKFIEKTWNVKEEHHKIITEQLMRIGSSCDWQRERFTLDDGLSEAVKEVFVRLYEDGLIYRGKYLINYCTNCGTALANDEVDHEEADGALYRVKYKIKDRDEYIEIATTRPETILGDTAVAVNPNDERYKHLAKDTKIIHPLIPSREMPLIRDEYVDIEFGTGALKITPAHDMNDFMLSSKHNLEIINILREDGTLNENTPKDYQGLSREEARIKTIEDLEALHQYLGKDDIKHQVGHCYRCKNVVEPYYSDQWFVKMKPLAEEALKVVKDGQIKIFPERWVSTYNHWLTDIRDWCISRQLWWGHRIPVWYCKDCEKMTVSKTTPGECSHCKSKNIYQDEDVLDTWFSSWIWPFSTLGFPKDTDDLKYFYPTSTLVSSFDILFFWIARMIMAGMHFMKEVPFKNVYLHGLVRDEHGRKMSKSLGNGIDPIEIIDEYGADAFRFTLAFITSLGQDVLLDRELFKMGYKFANKIYNSAKFIFSNIGENKVERLEKHIDKLSSKDKWILSRLSDTAGEVSEKMEGFRFDEVSLAMYKFYWNDFCDRYIELSKFDLREGGEAKDITLSVLIYILEESMALLHPIMPFITEQIYQTLPIKHIESGALIVRDYPKFNEKFYSKEIEKYFEIASGIVSNVRNIRATFNILNSSELTVNIVYTNDTFKNALILFEKDITNLTKQSVIKIVSKDEYKHENKTYTQVFEGGQISVNLEGLIDIEKEKERIKKDIAKYERELNLVMNKLSNENFVSKAKPEAVELEKKKESEFRDKLEKSKEVLASL